MGRKDWKYEQQAELDRLQNLKEQADKTYDAAIVELTRREMVGVEHTPNAMGVIVEFLRENGQAVFDCLSHFYTGSPVAAPEPLPGFKLDTPPHVQPGLLRTYPCVPGGIAAPLVEGSLAEWAQMQGYAPGSMAKPEVES
jgi:hypothetical protein